MTRNCLCIFFAVLVLLITVESASAKPWTVIDAVQSAISNHPQSLIAETISEEARGERRSTLALSPPVLEIRNDEIPMGKGLPNFEERRIGITQDFEFPLRYIWLSKAADLTVDQALIESRAVLLDLESEVRLAYLEAWVLSEQVKILEEYKDTLNTYWSDIRVESEHGRVSLLDARRSQVGVIEAENELRAFRRSMVAALARLSHMTNYDLTETDLISPLESDPVDTTRYVEQDLFTSNPEVLIARTEVDISGYEKTLASTAWLPELELNYYRRYDIVGYDPVYWTVELELSLPVWFWWGGVGEIQASIAQLKRAEAELAAYRLELAAECSQLAQELKTAYEQYELYQHELLPLAKDVYQMAQQSFQLGDGTYMDLIDAQEDLKDIQQDKIDIISELYEIKISLDRLNGNTIVNNGLIKGEF